MRYSLVSGALVIAALAASAGASSIEVSEFDARMALISDARDLEMKCAGLGMAQARRHQTLSLRHAMMLFDAVAERLGSDLGSEIHGMIQAGRPALHWTDASIPKTTLAKERAPLLGECGPIFKAARAGTLDRVLTPPSPAPLPLPDLKTCLAYAVAARQIPNEPALGRLSDQFEEAAKLKLAGSTEAERQRYDDSKAVEPAELSSQKLEAYLSWACVPALDSKATPKP